MPLSFVNLWVGQLVSLFGSALSTFVLSLWVYEQTGSALSMSVSLFSKFFPQIYLGFLLGPFVDSLNRKKALIIINLLLAVLTGLLAGLISIEHLTLNLFYGLAFCMGLLEGIQTLTLQTLPAMFLKQHKLHKANGMFTTFDSLARALGPGLAAALVLIFPYSDLLWIDAGTYAAAALPVALVRFPKQNSKPREALLIRAMSGMRFLLGHPKTRPIQFVYTSMNFLTGLTAGSLVPLILERLSSPQSLGFVQSIGAIGGILGGIWFMNNRRLSAKTTLIVALWMSALGGRLGVALAEGVYLLAGALALRGVSMSLMGAATGRFWQTLVPVSQQGQVFAARRLLSQGLYPVALLLGGWIGETIKRDELTQRSGWTELTGDASGLSLLFVVVGVLEITVVLQALWRNSFGPLKETH